jgi:hypothetical protein
VCEPLSPSTARRYQTQHCLIVRAMTEEERRQEVCVLCYGNNRVQTFGRPRQGVWTSTSG